MNTYGYVGGNPVMYSDPDGLFRRGGRVGNYVPLQELLNPRSPVTGPLLSPAFGGPQEDPFTPPMPGLGDPNSVLPEPEQCSDEDRCKVLQDEARRLGSEILGRLADMRTDKCQQYIHARYAPNPARNCGGNTTWVGHGEQIRAKRNTLTKVIRKLMNRHCVVPPVAWRALNAVIPNKPRGYK